MDTSRFHMREATKDDIPAMTDVFFHSFNAPIWQYLWPHTEYMRDWWLEAFTLGFDNPTDRTFVIEDVKSENKVVSLSRWVVPQQDGNQERKWPDMPAPHFDMEVIRAFFGGMDENRERLMGKRPHWFLEILGTHEDYQGSGLGSALIRWGTDQADAEGLETYLNATEKGQPFYGTHHAFKYAADVNVPERPSYGHYHEVSLIRPPRRAN